MELQYIEKKENGKYIKRYDLHYKTREGNEKIYEMVSHNNNETADTLSNNKTDAVIIACFNKDFSKICITKEYRLAVNNWIMNFPAGMIDEGETFIEAARRELKEETGLNIVEVLHTLPDSFSSVGLSNEKSKFIIVVADGDFGGNNNEYEEIIPGWYTKEEVNQLLKETMFSGRAQLFSYLWANNMINL